MPVKHTTKVNKLPQMVKSARLLNGERVEIGFSHGHEGWLAGIHDGGMTIFPKKQFLTVPLIPEARNRTAGSFGKELFFFEGGHGDAFLARKIGKKGSIQLVYWLARSVTIPARPFLLPGFDENVEQVLAAHSDELARVLEGEGSADAYLAGVGAELLDGIKDYARNLSSPANDGVTLLTKKGSNPLVESGNMIDRGIEVKK